MALLYNDSLLTIFILASSKTKTCNVCYRPFTNNFWHYLGNFKFNRGRTFKYIQSLKALATVSNRDKYLLSGEKSVTTQCSCKSQEPARKTHSIHPAANGHVNYKKQGKKTNKKGIRYENTGNHIPPDYRISYF